MLAPLAGLYAVVVLLRKTLYRLGIKKTYSFSVPVVVVGNITVGGSGKTPMVVWLVEHLRAQGHRPGIVSRGYGGAKNRYPTPVTEASAVGDMGDEALMLAQKTKAPFFIGVNRVKAVKALLKQHPDCSIVISDDGLQHYALKGSINIAILDETLEGNVGGRYYFPLGALRESRSRLQSVDFVLKREGVTAPLAYPKFPVYSLRVVPVHLCNLFTGERVSLDYVSGRVVQAVAGIGRPARFFTTLRELGCREVVEHEFPDHHVFKPYELDAIRESVTDPFILMTEKDAVKCRSFARSNDWYLVVEACVEDMFKEAFDGEKR